MHRTRGALLASFVADSLALGAHWEYDQGRIARELGRVTELLAPTLNETHPGKGAGAQSHYGDQALWLMQSVLAKGCFDLNDFATRWRENMQTYTGYLDKATKGTLHNFAAGDSPEHSGSGSTDFSAAGRIAPLLLVYSLGHGVHPGGPGFETATALVKAAKAQAMMTHSRLTAECAKFFCWVTNELLAGADMQMAVSQAAEHQYEILPALSWVNQARESLDEDSLEAVARLGAACDANGAMQSVLHLALKYEDDPEEGLIQNVMAGGDSCARGLMLGALFGIRHGDGWIPLRWLNKLRLRDELFRALKSKPE